MDDLDFGATIKGFNPGQKVFNRYTLQQIIGRGSTSVVWRVRDEELGREAALKFLPEMVAMDRAALSDLKNEVRRNLELAHPHIVKIYDLVTDNRSAAVSMEFVDGRTLASLRGDEPGQVFGPEKLLPWISQLCAALDYAHGEAKLVHRELKPANLMLDARGRLKLLDFGIAAPITDSASRVTRLDLAGPPYYMSPEQLMGEDAAATDDIYSLGATLFELLAGKPPFHSGNVVAQLQNQPAPLLNTVRQAAGLAPLPVIWEQTVAACLAKAAKDRPTSAGAVARQLESGRLADPPPPLEIKSTVPVEAPPVSAPAPEKPAGPPWWRVPAYRWAVAGGAVAVLAAVYWLGDISGRTRAVEAHAKGVAAKQAGNWAETLRALKIAATARPSDFVYHRDYKEAQAQWFRALVQRLDPLPPAEAYGALGSGANEVAGLLEDPVAGDYQRYASAVAEKFRTDLREQLAAVSTQTAAGEFAGAHATLARIRPHSALVPEYAGVLLEVQQAEVRQELAGAIKQSEAGEFAAALAGLDATGRRGLLAPEVAAAREQVKQNAELSSINRLATAILAPDTTMAQAALNDLAAYTGNHFTTTAAQLTEQRDLGAFLRALEEIKIRPTAGAPRRNRMDLVLVESLRSRFAAAGEVATFLGASYEEWAEELLAANQPGYALYAWAQARQAGRLVDTARENSARERLGQEFAFEFALTPTTGAGNTTEDISRPVRARLQQLLAKHTGAWAQVREGEPGSSGRVLRLNTRVTGIDNKADRTEAAKAARYQSGTYQENNPTYASLQSQLEQAEENYQRISEQNASTQAQARQMAGSGGLSGLGAVLTGLASGVSQNEVNKARRRVDELSSQLNRTPDTVTKASFANEPYREITHRVAYTASLRLAVEWAGREVGAPPVWAAKFSHQTVEVVGNAARNVPVAAPQYPASPQLADWLAKNLVEQISANPSQLFAPLIQASFLALPPRTTAAGAAPPPVADRRWGLAQLWVAGGIEPSNLKELERAVRAALGLPAR